MHHALTLNLLVTGALSRMLVGLDTETSNHHESEWNLARGDDKIAYWDVAKRGYDREGEWGWKRMILTGQWRDEESTAGWKESRMAQCYASEAEFSDSEMRGRVRYDPLYPHPSGVWTLQQCKDKCLEKEGCVAIEWGNGEATWAGIYTLGSKGSNSCPSGSIPITDYEECLEASYMVHATHELRGKPAEEFYLDDEKVYASHVPPYCSHKPDSLLNGGVGVIRFNTKRSGRNDGGYRPICKKQSAGNPTKARCQLAWACSSTKPWKGGSSYRLEKRVVTDVKLVASTNRDNVNCPRGYTRVGNWTPDNGGAVDSNGRKGYRDLALCEKRELCTEGKKYVSNFVAFASDGKSTPSTQDGAKRIGYWDTEHHAWSGYTNNRGHYNLALYQDKSNCPVIIEEKPKTCTTVEITGLEQVGATTGNLNGRTLRITGDTNHCVGDGEVTSAVNLSAGKKATDSSSYTLDESLSKSFSETLSSTVSVELEAGYKPPSRTGGGYAGVKLGVSLSRSQTEGFSNTVGRSDTKMHSNTQESGISASASVKLNTGEAVRVYLDLDGYTYEAKFKATAKCLDEDGNFLSSANISGVFSGQSWEAKAKITTEALDCQHSPEEPVFYKYTLRGSTGTETVTVDGVEYLLTSEQQQFQSTSASVEVSFTNDGSTAQGDDRNVYVERTEGTFKLEPVGGHVLRLYEAGDCGNDWRCRMKRPNAYLQTKKMKQKLAQGGMFWSGVYNIIMAGGEVNPAGRDLRRLQDEGQDVTSTSTLPRRLMGLEQEE